jgi:hypothetical protein
VEKLRHHVEVSQLHKDNLAKQQQEQAPTQESGEQQSAAPADKPTDYFDRAQQRRNLYGPETGAIVSMPAPLDSVPRTLSDAEANPPAPLSTNVSDPSSPSRHHDPLGASSVGHKMLQKLGWTGGGALVSSGGRAADGSEAQESRQAQLHAGLRREWDRSASAPGGRGNPRPAFRS